MNRLTAFMASLMLGLAACGGGGGAVEPPGPPAPAPISKTEAFRFLNQGTFGATEAEAAEVMALRREAWIDAQMQKPVSRQLPHLQGLPPPQFPFQRQTDRVDVWFRNAVNGDDQLRQRVAFALSEIMVVSQLSALNDMPYAMADYYDTLAEHAFGNYRELLEAITLHPAMGIYLSMLGNEKPDPVLNIRPDENYAREAMQLFSIGLVELNIDGSEKRDAIGQAIPTYSQEVIEGFAHVYTGWTFAGAAGFRQARPTAFNQVIPMQLYPEFHDTGEKMLLNGETLPAGQGGEQDLADALDNIFNHANVGPFIATRLIQRLAGSNPSPGYVRRVAEVFNDNGAGVRGDLGAVVKAILLDDEAHPAVVSKIDGKLKEPLLRITQLWRAYNASSGSGRFPLDAAYIIFGQGPLQSPSVFNFFSPTFAPPGEIRNNGLVAPELQIATEFQNTFFTNYMFYQVFALNQANDNLKDDDIFINIEEEMAIANDIEALIDRVDNKLLAGDMSTNLRAELSGMLVRLPANESALRASEAIYLVATSPEYAIQR